VSCYGQYTAAPQRYDKTRYQTVNFGSFWVRSTVEFRFFESTLHAGKVKAAVQFCLALCARALTSHGASARQRTYDPASAKYDLRVFLLLCGAPHNSSYVKWRIMWSAGNFPHAGRPTLHIMFPPSHALSASFPTLLRARRSYLTAAVSDTSRLPIHHLAGQKVQDLAASFRPEASVVGMVGDLGVVCRLPALCRVARRSPC
jgi:hypothetical protein